MSLCCQIVMSILWVHELFASTPPLADEGAAPPPPPTPATLTVLDPLVLCTLTSYTQMRAWPLTRVELLTCLAFMSENLMRTLHSLISCGVILGTLRWEYDVINSCSLTTFFCKFSDLRCTLMHEVFRWSFQLSECQKLLLKCSTCVGQMAKALRFPFFLSERSELLFPYFRPTA